MYRDESAVVERLVSYRDTGLAAQLSFDGRTRVSRKFARYRWLTWNPADDGDRSIRQPGYSARKDILGGNSCLRCSGIRFLGAETAGDQENAHQKNARVSDHFNQNKWKPLNPGGVTRKPRLSRLHELALRAGILQLRNGIRRPQRKSDNECRAFAGFALNVDGSPVRADDPGDEAESQPQSLLG